MAASRPALSPIATSGVLLALGVALLLGSLPPTDVLADPPSPPAYVPHEVLIAVDVDQLERNVKWASEFVPLSPEKMVELERRTLPIVRQALYFRRWEMGS